MSNAGEISARRKPKGDKRARTRAALLQAARALGDALAVAINGDQSVRALKGEGRPLVSEGG